MMKRRFIYIVVPASLVICLIFSVFTPILSSVSALSGSEFRAGRIIDNNIFFTGPGMSLNEVTNFLNAKVPACDTWGTKPYDGTTRAAYAASKGVSTPFTCLKDYRQNTPSRPAEQGLCYGSTATNNLSAAEIIYYVAESCGVNAKALITLLQKEQSLITDDWPWPTQYRSATGYGCPDTAPCDTEYYGFFNQVYAAARQFKRYIRDSTSFSYRAYRTNYVRYNPNAACGGSNIFIDNNATAALYNYTPYQPNNAALSNLYGLGDGCSAYGNRNFWRMFNDWFGPTIFRGVRPSHESNYAKAACQPPAISKNQVVRLYNPDTQDYLLTINKNEICIAQRYGYIYDGIVMSAISSDAVGASPVYRLSGYGRHIYTTSEAVKTNFQNQGYISEGIGFYAYTVQPDGIETTPVYCLVSGHRVIYTSSGGEKVGLEQSGFSLAGVAFLVPSFSVEETAKRYTDVYQRRLYTSNTIEQNNVKKYGFIYEPGGEFKVDRAPNINNSPLYRLRAPNSSFFYTTSRLERDLAVINYGYYSEGVAFYSPGNNTLGPIKIYRLTNNYTSNRLYTTSALERDLAVSRYGFTNEGTAWFGYNN